jgi:hypothetical protein
VGTRKVNVPYFSNKPTLNFILALFRVALLVFAFLFIGIAQSGWWCLGEGLAEAFK